MTRLERGIQLVAALAFSLGIVVACSKPGEPAATGPATSPSAPVAGGVSPSAVANAVPVTPAVATPDVTTAPALPPIPAPTTGAMALASDAAASTQPVIPQTLLDDAKRAHEQSAQIALANLQAMLANKDYDNAQRLAASCVKDYADTTVAPQFSPLLDQAKAAGTARTAGVNDAGRAAQFTTARDAGVAAMNRQDYPTAITQFQAALQLQDDPQTREMLQNATNFVGKPRVAVAEFDVIGDVGIADAGKVVPELTLGRFDPQRFQLVDRAWLDAVLAQQGLTLAQVAQMPELLRVKKVDAVRYLVLGSVSRLGSLGVSARLVDVSTGQVVQTADIAAADAVGLQNGLGELTAILQMTNEEKANYLAFRQQQVAALATVDPAQQAAAQQQCQAALDAQRQQAAQAQQIAFLQAQHQRDADAAVSQIQALLAQGDYANALRYIGWAQSRFNDTTDAQPLASLATAAQSGYQNQVAQQANAAAWARMQADLAARHQRFVQDRDQGMAALAAGDLVNAMTLLQNALSEEDNPYVRNTLDFIVRRMQRPGIAVIDFDVRGDIGLDPRSASRWLADLLLQQFGGADSPYRTVDRWELQADLQRIGLTMNDVRRDPMQPRLRMLREQVRYLIVGTAVHGSIDVATTLIDLQAGVPVQTAEFIAQDVTALPDALKCTAQVLQMSDDQKAAYLARLQYAGWMTRGDAAAAGGQWDVAVDAFAHACQIANTQDALDHLAAAQQQLAVFRQTRIAYDVAMSAAADAARHNDWVRALDAYRQAWAILPTPEAQAGVQNARAQVIAAARDRHALYLTCMASGSNYFTSGDLDRALDAYQEAYQVEPSPEAGAAVTQAQRALADRQQAKQRAYASAMNEARAAVQAGNWARALDAFQRAVAIMNTREAGTGVDMARKKLAEQQSNQKIYDKYMADGRRAAGTGDWPGALDAYQHAAVALNSAEVQAAIQQAKKQIALNQQQNQKKIYDTAMASAQAHATAGQWQEALADYRSAYQADKTKDAAAGIAQATKMLNDAAYAKKQYDSAMATGDSAAKAGQWAKALAAYQQAASINATAEAKAGSDNAKAQIAAAAAADKQHQYTQLMNDGDAAARAGDLQKALVAYNKAAAINNTPQVQAAIADTQKKITDSATAAAKKKDFDAAMATGDAAARAGQWQKALDAYTKAAGVDNTAAAQAGIANAKAKLDAAATATMAATEKKKQFDAAMTDGDAAAKAGDWHKALDAYTKAAGIDNTPAVQTAIANAKKKISDADAAATAADKKKQYDALVAAGDTAGKAGNWQVALDSYTKAQQVDNTPEIKTAIANARKQIADAAATSQAAAKKQQYDSLVAAGDAAGKSGNWQAALDSYTKAQQVDNTSEIKTAIANARKQIADAAAASQAAAKKQQYDSLVAAGDAAGKSGNWQAALDSYTKAQQVDNTSEIKTAIANARKQIADTAAAAAAEQKKKQYDAFMSAGNAAGQAGNWQAALDNFTKAVGVDNTPEARDAQANARKQITATADAAAKKRQYTQFMTEGDTAARASQWQKALDAYTKAAAVDDTPEAQTGIANAKQKLADATTASAAAADKKKELDQAIADGDAAGKANDWQGALDAYTKAAGIENTAAVQQKVASAKQKFYTKLMSDGDAAGKANDWQTALNDYTKAQGLNNTAAVQTAIANAKKKLGQ